MQKKKTTIYSDPGETATVPHLTMAHHHLDLDYCSSSTWAATVASCGIDGLKRRRRRRGHRILFNETRFLSRITQEEDTRRRSGECRAGEDKYKKRGGMFSR